MKDFAGHITIGGITIATDEKIRFILVYSSQYDHGHCVVKTTPANFGVLSAAIQIQIQCCLDNITVSS